MHLSQNLLPETASVLHQLSQSELLNDFTFVGRSALSVYLSHRLSEDIDLFTWHKQINPIEIQQQLAALNFENMRIANLSSLQADFILNGVKITFFANGWAELQNRKQIENFLYIAELQTLAVMKVNTLFLRAKFRDYYDLYVLNLKQYTLQQLFELTEARMKNLSKLLFQKALIFTSNIDDENIKHLHPTHKVTLNDMAKHFEKEIRKWNKNN